MEDKTRNKILYFISIFAPVICLAFDRMLKLLQTSYSQNFKMPAYVFFLSILVPVMDSLLFYVKILYQEKMKSNITKNLNLLATVLFLAGIMAFYIHFGFWFFVTNHALLAFVICLQLCSVAYDVFVHRD